MRHNLTVVKIDLCGSKAFCDQHAETAESARAKLVTDLTRSAEATFPEADTQFPEGSFYKTEGDALYLLLDRPTVALRCSIEFQKKWYGKVPKLPDCRIVIDYGEIEEVQDGDHSHIVGEPFENLSIVEKHVQAGQIGVTQAITRKTDSTLVGFSFRETLPITTTRSVDLFLANYEDPRLIKDSALAHALFIANPAGAEIRERAFEALLIEGVLENEGTLSLSAVDSYMRSKSCPILTTSAWEEIVSNSHFLEMNDRRAICLQPEASTTMQDLSEQLEQSRIEAIDHVADALATQLGLAPEAIKRSLNLPALIEEFLCAVFLEIRMMANYFKSTNTLFDRLSAVNEFDYILRRHLSGSKISNQLENFIFIKKAFLTGLSTLAIAKNRYIASIFHNVLILYYMNRPKASKAVQLENLRQKEIYFDTNALYALLCTASDFHEMLEFAFQRLRNLGIKIRVFDQSLREYCDSLDSALYQFGTDHGRRFVFTSHRPWIWTEFHRNRTRYSDDFSYCVALHKLPRDSDPLDPNSRAKVEKECGQKNMILEELTPFLDQEGLGSFYYDVLTVKSKYDKETGATLPTGKHFEERLLHDANCLNHLKPRGGQNPYASEVLFVTCDFGLSRIRRRCKGEFEFVIVVPEFYEFMLPYLFLGDSVGTQPVDLPNFLLAALTSKELCQTIDLETKIGDLLAGYDTDLHDYELMAVSSNSRRYENIRERYLSANAKDVSEAEIQKSKALLDDMTSAAAEYLDNVRESTAKALVQSELSGYKRKIEQLEENVNTLESKNIRLEQKDKKRMRYRRKERRRKEQRQSKK